MEVFHGTATECVTCHMGSHSVTCYPTQVNTPRLNASHAGRYSIYLPRRDGRLSWPSWLGLIAPWPGAEPATFRSRVQRPTNASTKTTVIWCSSPEQYPRISAYTLHFQNLVIAYIVAAGSMGLSSFKFVQLAPKDASFLHQSACWSFKAIQGHPRSMILVPIESAYATSY